MKPIVLESIPVHFDVDAIAKRLHVRAGRGLDELRRIALEAESVVRPKAMYGEAFIESRTEESVSAEGITLTSRALKVNLEPAHRFFPYVATCGVEADEWSKGFDDLLSHFYADALCEAALLVARVAMEEDLAAHFRPGHTSAMNPGSLIDWPITQQGPLFRLLGDPLAAIGVHLTDGFMMVPVKSVSGIRYPTQTTFENCMLCAREGCPGRRAEFEKDKYEREYAQH
jgi:hypothetical protein